MAKQHSSKNTGQNSNQTVREVIRLSEHDRNLIAQASAVNGRNVGAKATRRQSEGWRH